MPYIGHLLGVCGIALENGADEDEAIAALLHDSIEDQAEGFGGADKLREHIRAEFGEKALAIVEGCTDAETVPKPPWRERKEKYVAHLAGASASVLLVFGLGQALQRPGDPAGSPGDRRRRVVALYGREGRHALVLPGVERCVPSAREHPATP